MTRTLTKQTKTKQMAKASGPSDGLQDIRKLSVEELKAFLEEK